MDHESPNLCNGLCCPTQYPTPAPHIMGFNLIDSCGRLREQLVLQGLFDILYCGNIIVNDLNNVCDCFNENVCFNENLSQSQSQSSSEFISSQQPPQSQSQSSKTFTITIPQNDRNWQLLTSLCGKGIISKKYSQKLKMPQDYPVEIKFNIGVHEIQLREEKVYGKKKCIIILIMQVICYMKVYFLEKNKNQHVVMNWKEQYVHKKDKL